MRRLLRRAALIPAALALMLAAGAAASLDLRMLGAHTADAIRRGMQSAEQVFAGGGAAQAELSLPEREIFALQLAVFDSGERAAAQAQSLQTTGVRCIIWQGERLRIVSDAMLGRESLDTDTAKGHDTYVYRETLPAVTLRLEAGAQAIDSAQHLLTLPDSVLTRLADAQGGALPEIVAEVRETAESAVDAHPEQALYTQLAQSLVNWCELMEAEIKAGKGEELRGYARATMCALCRELRRALTA